MRTGKRLDDDTTKKPNVIRGEKGKPEKYSIIKQKVKEHFSQHDIEELMGVHRDTYVRRGGAIKRK